MSERYPRIRVQSQSGGLLIREGLSLCFYMHRSHQEIARAVLGSLNAYHRAVGPRGLAWYPDMEGDWQELDAPAWERIQKDLLESPDTLVTLVDRPDEIGEYRFEYRGYSLDSPSAHDWPGRACSATFWLSTEYLERHGPGQVRELALELASHLPFNSGYASLSFHALMDLAGVDTRVHELCFRYPGMDVPDPYVSWRIGTKIRGAYWLTFLGQPVLSELRGVEGLRTRLSSPGTTLQSLEGDRAVVTLGQWPEAGDIEAGNDLPHYQELARALKPFLFETPASRTGYLDTTRLRWERRFLD